MAQIVNAQLGPPDGRLRLTPADRPLPVDYVRTSTGLGYATTIHSAQGVSADTMHGLLTGQESRQQLYTMLSRGRHANHLYLRVVGDGDPHTVIRSDTISPRTPTETLQQILGCDEAPVSANTLLRELNNPAARLFQAVQRYTDGLHVAAEQLLGPQTVAELDQADPYLPGLTTEPAWPTLWAHLTQCGAPPMASIPKTRDQPEEANSRQPPPSGNNTSTRTSRVPPTRQQMHEPTNDRQHTPHLDAGMTTASATTKHPVSVRTGHPHPATNPVAGCYSPDAVKARGQVIPTPSRTADSGSN